MVDYSRCMTEDKEREASRKWGNGQLRESLEEELRQLEAIYSALAKHDERESAAYVDKMRTSVQEAINRLGE